MDSEFKEQGGGFSYSLCSWRWICVSNATAVQCWSVLPIIEHIFFIFVIPIMDEQSKCATMVLIVRHFDMICRCKHDLQKLLRIYLALGGWKRASCRNQGNKRCINVDFNYLLLTKT